MKGFSEEDDAGSCPPWLKVYRTLGHCSSFESDDDSSGPPSLQGRPYVDSSDEEVEPLWSSMAKSTKEWDGRSNSGDTDPRSSLLKRTSVLPSGDKCLVSPLPDGKVFNGGSYVKEDGKCRHQSNSGNGSAEFQREDRWSSTSPTTGDNSLLPLAEEKFANTGTDSKKSRHLTLLSHVSYSMTEVEASNNMIKLKVGNLDGGRYEFHRDNSFHFQSPYFEASHITHRSSIVPDNNKNCSSVLTLREQCSCDSRGESIETERQ